MPEIVQTGDVCTLLAPPVRLIFRWDGDRWSHSLAVGETVLAFSLEWGPAQADPTRVVSPAYQQISASETQALVVGQWGRHHFSGVFSLSAVDGGVVVEIDAAARSRAPLEVLASTYRVLLPSGALGSADPSGVEWIPGPAHLGLLRLEPGVNDAGLAHVNLAEGGRLGKQVQIVAPLLVGASTHRMVYRWRWLLH